MKLLLLAIAVAAGVLVVELAHGAEVPHGRELQRMTWPQAVAIVDRHLGYGEWLLSCSRAGSEGGYGRWFWNGGRVVEDVTRRRLLQSRSTPPRPAGSSGAGGWLQFLSPTFDSVIVDAVAHARAHGLVVLPLARSWLHPLGQAVAGVEMLRDGRVREWSGWGC